MLVINRQVICLVVIISHDFGGEYMGEYTQTCSPLGIEALPLHLQLRSLASQVAETMMMAKYGRMSNDEFVFACDAANRLASVLSEIKSLLLSTKLPATKTELIAYSIVDETEKNKLSSKSVDNLAIRADDLRRILNSMANISKDKIPQHALSLQQEFNTIAMELSNISSSGE